MLDTRNDVELFMVAGDQNDKGFGSQSDLYLNLITEEVIHETLKAFDTDNIIEIADGIADSIWVIEGFCITLGIPLSHIWANVQTYMLYNDLIIDEKDIMVEDVISRYVDVRSAYRTFDTHVIEQPIESLITSLLFLSEAFNIPLQAVWDEVSRSNMSKISSTGKVIKNEFGKIQKPESFSPADVESVLIEYGIV